MQHWKCTIPVKLCDIMYKLIFQLCYILTWELMFIYIHKDDNYRLSSLALATNSLQYPRA